MHRGEADRPSMSRHDPLPPTLDDHLLAKTSSRVASSSRQWSTRWAGLAGAILPGAFILNTRHHRGPRGRRAPRRISMLAITWMAQLART
jgi:hypothetical protein